MQTGGILPLPFAEPHTKGLPCAVEIRRARLASVLLGFVLVSSALLLGSASGIAANGPAPLRTITDPLEFWAMPTPEKALAHPIRLEGRVSYYDPLFSIFWFDIGNGAQYIHLGDNPPRLVEGQHVVIEGKMTPQIGLRGQDVTVRVIEANAPIVPISTQGRLNDFEHLGGRIISVEGYVDRQVYVDDDHVRMVLIAENRPVICWLKPDNPNRVPDWRGSRVRITGLYSSRFDLTQTATTIEVWSGRQDDLQVIGTLATDPAFDRKPTPIAEVVTLPQGSDVVVRGIVEKQVVGRFMVVKDASGLIEVRTIQQQRFSPGTEVEATGKAFLTSGIWSIDDALCRTLHRAKTDITAP